MLAFQDPSLVFGVIPVALLSGVIGAGIAIVGNWIQNSAHAKRQKDQQQFDAEQRRLDKEANLRRETYVAAISSIARHSEYISKFGDYDITSIEHQKMLEGTESALLQIRLTSDLDTRVALHNLQNAFAKACLALNPERLKFDESKIQAEHLLKVASLCLQRRNQLAEFSVKVKETGEQKLLDQIYADQAAVEAEYKELEALWKNAEAQVGDLLFNLGGKVIVEKNKFDKAITDFLLCARKEIGMPIDEAKFKEITERKDAELDIQFKKFLKSRSSTKNRLLE